MILGISTFDAIAVGSAHLTTSDDANTAASAAASDFQSSHSAASALRAATDAITNPNETMVPGSFTIETNGSVSLLVQRKVTTLVMFRIGPLKKYTLIKIRGEATAPA